MAGHGHKELDLLFVVALMQSVNGQLSATTQFHAVQSGGVPQCSTDPPSLALRARSRLDCSKLCVQLRGESCAGFNFRRNHTNCELFNSAELSYNEIPSCTLYQMARSSPYTATDTAVTIPQTLKITSVENSMTPQATNEKRTTSVTIELTSKAASVMTEETIQTTSITNDQTSNATGVMTEPISKATSVTAEAKSQDTSALTAVTSEATSLTIEQTSHTTGVTTEQTSKDAGVTTETMSITASVTTKQMSKSAGVTTKQTTKYSGVTTEQKSTDAGITTEQTSKAADNTTEHPSKTADVTTEQTSKAAEATTVQTLKTTDVTTEQTSNAAGVTTEGTSTLTSVMIETASKTPGITNEQTSHAKSITTEQTSNASVVITESTSKVTSVTTEQTPQPKSFTAEQTTKTVTTEQASPATSVTTVPTSKTTSVTTEPNSTATSVTSEPTSKTTSIVTKPTPKATSVLTEPTSETTSLTTEPTSQATSVTTDKTSPVISFSTETTGQTTSIKSEPTSKASSVTTEPTIKTTMPTAATTSQGNCPPPPNSMLCSFPFTYNGNLHYNCIKGITYNSLQNELACLAHNWTWIACPLSQANFTAQNITMNITIPTLTGTTPAMTVNGWIIIQQQLTQTSSPASKSFNQNWATYASGFGTLGNNYYMGNTKIHLLTQSGTTYRLRIEMLFTAYGWMSAEYDQFSIDNATGLYRLHLACYSNGECGDSLQYIQPSPNSWYQNGMAFSTQDKANDNSPSNPRCAKKFSSGFWYNNCYWALVWGDVASDVGWWTMSSATISMSRTMIKPFSSD